LLVGWYWYDISSHDVGPYAVVACVNSLHTEHETPIATCSDNKAALKALKAKLHLN